MSQGQQHQKPTVVLISLEKSGWFDEMYESLINELEAKANVVEITSSADVTKLFAANETQKTILATDGALFRSENSSLRADAVNFVQNGGTVVFGCDVPSFTSHQEIKDLFSAFSLPWEAGDYHRTVFELNPRVYQVATSELVARYSQKALHLKNVDKDDAKYIPSDSSRIQSWVFDPSSVEDLTQTPAATRTCGGRGGKVGYLGDVNAESATNKAVLAMCGLID